MVNQNDVYWCIRDKFVTGNVSHIAANNRFLSIWKDGKTGTCIFVLKTFKQIDIWLLTDRCYNFADLVAQMKVLN